MKKVIKFSSLLLAFALLAISLSSCGKISGSKYKNDEDNKEILSFSSTSEFNLSYDGKEIVKGTYKIEKSKITLTGKRVRDDGKDGGSFTVIFTIEDSKKTKLKDPEGGTWTKIWF